MAPTGTPDEGRITTRSEDGLFLIGIDRPRKLNGFSLAMYRQLAAAFDALEADESARVGLLYAQGANFTAGLQLDQFAPLMARGEAASPPGSIDPFSLREPFRTKPVVCAVQGMCAGGGQYFVNECDIVICSQDAVFFDPHANGGIVSALEPIGMLHRGVPLGDVLRWALMGTEERITADTALRLGLVSEVVPTDQLRARAAEIAAQIAERNPIAIQGTVRAIWEAIEMTPHMAKQNGLAYTHIGNKPAPDRVGQPRVNRRPTFR